MTSEICDNLENYQKYKLNYLTVRENKQNILKDISNCINFYKEAFNNIMKQEEMFTYINKHIPHPLHFELGHIVYFFEYHFLGNIKKYSNIKTEKKLLLNDNSHSNIFDSLINKPEDRSINHIFTLNEQLDYSSDIFEIIKNELEIYPEKLLSPIDTYILKLCLIHYEMHKEVIYFITNQQKIEVPLQLKNADINYESNSISRLLENDWIHIDVMNKNYINIGCCKNQNNENRIVIFDNECPENIKHINSFYCQKYPVTYGEYMEFIKNNGYNNTKYWSFEGWKWKKENNINHPINLIYKEDKWYRRHFNKVIELDYELPVVHVSYYEALAYSKYRNARLISEEEYVYLTTNGGENEYPWGNDKEVSDYCNSDYINSDVIKVNSELNKKGVNKFGIYGLMGSCWYWTSSRFAPFDGFAIDPIYDTFSYPFFYDRIIIKGSSWCTGKDLVYSKYRNSQEPDKCFHFTGIRLCKDY